MTDVFISYKSDDFEKADEIRKLLEKNSITCWMAPMSISGGASYASEIPKAISECNFFVLIITPNVFSSIWVPKELDQAINEKKTVMPIFLEKCELNDEFGFYLRNIQFYEASRDRTAIEKLVNQIKLATGNNNLVKICDVADTHKARKEKNAKKKKPQTNKKFIKCFFMTLTIIITLIVAVSIISNTLNKISIAGLTFDKRNQYFKFENVEVSEEDIEKLLSIKNIITLSFENCRFYDLEKIAPIFYLDCYYLTLSECGITDECLTLVDFSRLSATNLNLDGNKGISNPVGLSKAVDLTKLSLNSCSLKDINFVKTIKGLEELSVENNNITSLLDLSNCKNLEVINVSNNSLESLNGLENAIYLRSIDAANNSIFSINGLINSTVLTVVDLSNNMISDISVLNKSSENITKLYLSNNLIQDIQFLSDCNKITDFYIDNNNIKDISVTENFENLMYLVAQNNNIEDIKSLSNLKKLKELNLSGNKIKSIQAIRKNSESSDLQYLNLSDNLVVDFSLSQGNYGKVYLNGNYIDDLSSLVGSEIDTLAFDYSDTINFEELATIDCNKFVVYNCPLDHQVYVGETLYEYKTEFK